MPWEVSISPTNTACITVTRRSVKWWRKVLFWAMEVGIVNSYILYRMNAANPMSQLQFRREIILSVCSTFPTVRQMMRRLPTEERFQGRHYIDSGALRRRCLVCGTAKSNHRSSTQFFCKTCSNHPPLHPITCFEKYHECRRYLH